MTDLATDTDSFALTAPIDIEPGGQVRVFLQQTSLKFAADTELFTNKVLTNLLEFEFRYDRSQFEAVYRPIHSRETFADMATIDDADRIRFRHPFLPSNGLVVWWRPRTTPDGAGGPDGAKGTDGIEGADGRDGSDGRGEGRGSGSAARDQGDGREDRG